VTEETLARRAMARHRQIIIGKSRPEYKLYVSEIPPSKRTRQMPCTPDAHARISKRAFDRELACWRRGLHILAAQIEALPPDRYPVEAFAGIDEAVEMPCFPDLKSKIEDWSPASACTESTRADTEVDLSSPDRLCVPSAESVEDRQLWNVKLNLFEHLPPQQAQPAAYGVGVAPAAAAMQQVFKPMPALVGSWDPRAAGINVATMSGVMPGTAVLSESTMCTPMAPPPVPVFSGTQQQSTYCCGAQAAPWLEVPMPWSSQHTMSAHCGMTEQNPGNAGSGSPSAMGQQQVALHSVGHESAPMHNGCSSARQIPSSPKPSKHNFDDAPSTPLSRMMKTIASPAIRGGWLRTPSPDRFSSLAHYAAAAQTSLAHFAAETAPSSSVRPEEFIPCPQWSLMVAVQAYCAEADGYLSVAAGSQVRALTDSVASADPQSAWPSSVYCCQGEASGWVPQALLWRCYSDRAGRLWAYDEATSSWLWVDELIQASH
jgi:hypothetical protein